MPIKNYSTVVPAEKSAAQIISLLAKKGAVTISQKFSAGGELTALCFTLNVSGSEVPFVLPANVDGVADALKRAKPFTSRSRSSRSAWELRIHAEARWVAWRILKDWVEAQLAMIEANMVTAPQVFLPYAMHESGETLYERFLESRAQLSLGEGGSR